MSEQATPGKGLHNIAGRLQKLERILSPFTRKRITAKDGNTGKDSTFDTLAGTLVPSDGARIPFALGSDSDGATIEWGKFLASVTLVGVTLKQITVDSTTHKFQAFAYQDEIEGCEEFVPSNLESDRTKSTKLGWWGDVWLYWIANEEGAISGVEIKGPAEPETTKIGKLQDDGDDNLVRDPTEGTYAVKIGTVDQGQPIKQDIIGNVFWSATIFTSGAS